jgi:eukaryotic-like serine/threonine-protein kinase
MEEALANETPFEQEVEETPTETWGLEEGDEIAPGRYALKKLGGGTDYEAYLAWDDKLAFVLVAKVLRPHLVEDEWALKGLAREAQALSELDHPLLVRGFGAVLRGERPHVLMEHLEGPHLARLIRRYGPLPLEQLIPLAINLCSVAHYLSTEKMLHLDIKPRNIVVGVPPRLIDLSIARSFSRAERITGHVGTDLYMAPEQCEPNKHFKIGPPADVWGIGATLYHAAAGRRPFERPDDYDESDLEVRFPQLSQEPAPLNPKTVPPAVGEVIMDCLLRDPTERPPAREVMDRLEPVLASLPRRHRLGRLRPRL